MTPCVVARLARMRLLWYFRNMFAPRNRFLAVAAALLGAAFAPRPTDASIPSAISRPQFAQVAAAAPTLPAAPTTPSHILLYVAPDGSCQVEFCRNDPVNLTDPMGLESVWGRQYEVRVQNGTPEVQINVGRVFDKLEWRGATENELGWYFSRTDQDSWRVATDAEIMRRWNARKPEIWAGTVNQLADTFNPATVDRIEKIGVAAVCAPFVVVGAMHAWEVLLYLGGVEAARGWQDVQSIGKARERASAALLRLQQEAAVIERLLEPKTGRKLTQQLTRWREIGGSGGATEFLEYATRLSQQAQRAGTVATGRVGSSANALENATIYRVGKEYLVVQGNKIMSYVANADPGGVAEEYKKLGGQ